MNPSAIKAAWMWDPGTRSVERALSMRRKLANLVPTASATLVQRNERRRFWNNPKPESENSGSG